LGFCDRQAQGDFLEGKFWEIFSGRDVSMVVVTFPVGVTFIIVSASVD
jgi:hypothetical protein